MCSLSKTKNNYEKRQNYAGYQISTNITEAGMTWIQNNVSIGMRNCPDALETCKYIETDKVK